MYPYIRCFCGMSLGDIYDLFKELRLEKYRKYYAENDIHIQPDFIQMADQIQLDLTDIFAQLGITNVCCKARIVSQVEFSEYY